MRTAFNLLGPLTNPAGATAQLVGAPSTQAAELMAKTLACLGLQKGFIVHGADGLDEISTTSSTHVLEITKGAIADRVVTPEDFGVPRAKLADLRGGDKDENAAIARDILAGERGPRRDIVLVNASAALVVAHRAKTFEEGMAMAAESIDSGAATAKAKALAEFTNRY
jgi:anthranilate phosphoribosyltransferase